LAASFLASATSEDYFVCAEATLFCTVSGDFALLQALTSATISAAIVGNTSFDMSFPFHFVID
jgi:hypothetical protein